MNLAFELSWDPEIRAILVVALAVVVLPGSTYLILGTNLGARLGFLVAFAGIFGWLSIMAVIWTVYGIGYIGDAPSWKLVEVVRSDSATELPTAILPAAPHLSTWREPPADPRPPALRRAPPRRPKGRRGAGRGQRQHRRRGGGDPHVHRRGRLRRD